VAPLALVTATAAALGAVCFAVTVRRPAAATAPAVDGDHDLTPAGR
jgi:hypothetical protein